MAVRSEQLISPYVEYGRHTADEVRSIVTGARSGTYAGRPLRDRPWMQISLPGAVVDRLGPDVVLGVPRAVLDDHALRKVSRACPDVWLDGRWYPADVEGFHLVLATTLTVSDPGGIAQEVAALLDVPADEAHFSGGDPGGPLRFIRLAWRPPR